MASQIVLPSLTNWVEEHLQNIFNAQNQADCDTAFDAFMSKHATITLNGKRMSRSDYKKRLEGELKLTGDATPASVTFNGVVEVPDSTKNTIDSGAVGLFYQATLFGKFFVLGSRTSSTIESSLNVEVVQDKSLHHPKQVGTGGAFDGRRVSVLNEVSIDKTDVNPIVNPGGPIAPPTTTTA